ncbi:hypothetical protein U1Q18_004795 [Sarracenia purpurea var. burkii]
MWKGLQPPWANAVRPLVRPLEAFLTLIEGDQLQKGSKVVGEANAIAPMIKLLSSTSNSLQEKALKALQRSFQLVEFKQKYGAPAQLSLVEITQRGTSSMKSLAAKTLARLLEWQFAPLRPVPSR